MRARRVYVVAAISGRVSETSLLEEHGGGRRRSPDDWRNVRLECTRACGIGYLL